MAEQREQKEREKKQKKYEKKEESPMYRADGQLRQCNEGKFKFRLREWDDPSLTFFDINIPKYF